MEARPDILASANIPLPIRMGHQVRSARKSKGLSIRAAAQLLKCSPRFMLQLEQGKATARMDKVLQTLSGLGLQFSVHADSANGDAAPPAQSERSAQMEARAKHGFYEERLARAHERIAALLALDAIEPGDIERARNQVRKWADQKICSQWYVDQWTGILAGSGREIASRMLKLKKDDAKALFQNTPFGFLVREFLRA